MQGSARKDVVFGAARVYTVTVPGPKWKSWFNKGDTFSEGFSRSLPCCFWHVNSIAKGRGICQAFLIITNSIFEALDPADEKPTEKACGKAAPFNIEAAVAIPAADGPEVWVGLRGPLVEMEKDGEPRRFAVMLRMENQEKLSFDSGALVDLGGFAIRELTVAGGWVWGIGGPPEDSTVAFKLWRFPIRSLRPDATIQPELLSELLPTSSEGLALSGSTAFVVIDGDWNKSNNSCDVPARYQAVRVPNY